MEKILFHIFLLITTIHCQYVYVSGYAPTITAYTARAGTLTSSSASTGPSQPSFMAFHPTKAVAYAIDESGNTVTAYTIGASGSLTKMNTISSGGSGPAHISIHPSGNYLYTTNYGSGNLSIATTLSDGSIGTQIFNELAGVNAHMAITDPLGKFLFVVCKGSDYIVQYDINVGGTVTRNSPALVTFPSGSGPRHIAFHPTRNFVYLITELSSQVITLTYNPTTGTLYGAQALSSLPASYTGGNTGAEIQTSPDGRFVYASNRGANNVGLWSINGDGTLTSVDWTNGGGDINVPRHFSIDPTGSYLYVANQNGNSVTIFSVASATGLLTKLTTMPTTNQPSFVLTWTPATAPATSTTAQTTTSTTSTPTSTSTATKNPTSSPATSASASASTSITACVDKDNECASFCAPLIASKCDCDPATGGRSIMCAASSGATLASSFAALLFIPAAMLAL